MSAVRKIYLQNPQGDLRIPMREVQLSNGDSVVLYDTSGPYTDEDLKTDVRTGLPKLRAPWAVERRRAAGLTGPEGRNGGNTQLGYARAGVVTTEMEFIAIRVGVAP